MANQESSMTDEERAKHICDGLGLPKETRAAFVREFAEVREEARDALKRRLDYRLNDHLCEMKPDCDDSIVGFNEAWDIMRVLFDEESRSISSDKLCKDEAR